LRRKREKVCRDGRKGFICLKKGGKGSARVALLTRGENASNLSKINIGDSFVFTAKGGEKEGKKKGGGWG